MRSHGKQWVLITTKRTSMDNQIRISVRVPREAVKQIEKIVKPLGSTLSQFVRTATLNAISASKRAA